MTNIRLQIRKELLIFIIQPFIYQFSFPVLVYLYSSIKSLLEWLIDVSQLLEHEIKALPAGVVIGTQIPLWARKRRTRYRHCIENLAVSAKKLKEGILKILLLKGLILSLELFPLSSDFSPRGL